MKGKFQESGQLRKELWKHKEAAKNKELLKESHLKTLSELRKESEQSKHKELGKGLILGTITICRNWWTIYPQWGASIALKVIRRSL